MAEEINREINHEKALKLARELTKEDGASWAESWPTQFRRAKIVARAYIDRMEPVEATWKDSLKKGYAYCTCKYPNGAPFILICDMKFCPNCGSPIKWRKDNERTRPREMAGR